MKYLILAVLTLSFLGQSPDASAQRGRRKPGSGGFREPGKPDWNDNRIPSPGRWERQRYDKCERRFGSNNDPLASEKVRICREGEERGERMADQIASRMGRFDGYKSGYSVGVCEASQYYRDNSTTDYEEGVREATRYDGFMTNGVSSEGLRGSNDGSSFGSSEAVRRFRNYVDQGNNSAGNPDNSLPSTPSSVTTYTGKDNGFRDTVPNAWRDEEYFLRDGVRNGSIAGITIYTDFDSVYFDFDRFDRIDPWDIYRGCGQFWSRSWDSNWELYDGEWAFRQWRKGRDRDVFERLLGGNNGRDDRRPGNGGGGNGPGRGGDGPGRGGDQNPNPNPSLTEDQAREIFKSGFKTAYLADARWQYSDSFHRNRPAGYGHGMMAGTYVGRQLARFDGLVDTYDDVYKDKTRVAYIDKYEENMRTGFQNQYSTYLNSTVLEVQLDSVTTPIGIYEAGQVVNATYRVTNYGGKETNLKTTLAGNVVNPQTVDGSIGRLAKLSLTAAQIAQIPANYRPRQPISFVLRVNDKEDTIGATSNSIVEITNVDTAVSAVAGTANIRVDVRNMSPISKSGLVKLTGRLNVGNQLSHEFGEVGASNPATATLSFAALDPMYFLNRALNASVELTMGDRLLDNSATIPLTHKSEDAYKADLAAYADALIRDLPGVIVPGGDKLARLREVALLVAEYNLTETRQQRTNDDLWKKTPSQTLVGKLVELRERTLTNATAASRYKDLGVIMYCHKENLASSFHSAKDDYKNLNKRLRGFSKDADDDKDWRNKYQDFKKKFDCKENNADAEREKTTINGLSNAQLANLLFK